MPRRRRVLCLPLLALSGVAHAQANYGDVPLGGRTATMGGVGVAAGTDSAMPYLNPAGMAGLPGDVFALSTTVHAVTFRRIDGYLHPNGFGFDVADGREQFSSRSVTELPSAVLYRVQLGDAERRVRHSVVVSLVVPSAQSMDVVGSYSYARPDVDGAVSEARTLHFESADEYFGPTWATAVGDRLRLGASAFALHQATTEQVQDEWFDYIFGGAAVSSETRSTTRTSENVSLVPVAGLQWAVAGPLSVGVSVASPSIRVYGRSTTITTVEKASAATREDHETLEADAANGRPLRVAAGVALERPHTWAVGADVSFYAPLPRAVGESGVAHVTTIESDNVVRDYDVETTSFADAEAVVNGAVGGEVWLGEWLALRLGAFTNASPFAHPRGEPDALTVDRFGVTGGVGLLAGSVETTLGVVWQHGAGTLTVDDRTSTQAVETGTSLVDVDYAEDALMVVLSGAVSLDRAKRRIRSELGGGP